MGQNVFQTVHCVLVPKGAHMQRRTSTRELHNRRIITLDLLGGGQIRYAIHFRVPVHDVELGLREHRTGE